MMARNGESQNFEIWAEEGRGNRKLEKTTQQVASCFALLTQYYSGHQVKKNKMGGTCGTYGKRRGSYSVLVVKPEGKR
jgi:hypothetical protein